MSKEIRFLNKNSFTSGSIFTGFIKDSPDSRDYKFSDLLKQKGEIKTVKKEILQPKPLTRGVYRKAGYKAPLVKVLIPVDVVTKKMLLRTPLNIDNSDNMSPVKDQGYFGACVAFAAAAMKECQEKKEHNKEVELGKKDNRDNKEYNYSEQWLYWNCKKIDSWPNEEGTDLRSVMKVLNKIGVPTETAWPYRDSPINIGKPKSWASLIARWATIGSYWSISNLTELKIALIDGPVIIGVPVFSEWWNPPKGVISYPLSPNKILGGHGVCCVGYDDSTGLIKFKNSWSSEWGDNGYGYLSFRYINDFLWSAWAARDISVTSGMLKGSVSL